MRFTLMSLSLILASTNLLAQTVASEALSIQCFKGKQTADVRLEKSLNTCKLERTQGTKKKTLFEDKQSSENCETSFQAELKRLRKSGFKCE